MAKNKSTESAPVLKKENKSASRALSPFEEMDRMFETMLGRTWPRSWLHPFHWERPAWAELNMPFGGQLPKVDVIERDNEILVRAEVPGVKKEDLDISMTDNTVTISGRISERKEEKTDNYYRSETSKGEFTRTVALPGEVDADKATAKLDNGLLELLLPKVDKSKRKTVKVD